MTTIYLAIQCGPDYDVAVSAHATLQQAQSEVCDWLDTYGSPHDDGYREMIDAGKVAILAGETAYMNDGEHWYEVRAVEIEGAPLSGQTRRDTQPAREAIANADAHLNNAGLQTYSELRAALAGAHATAQKL